MHFLNINSLRTKHEQIRTALRDSPSTSLLALCEIKLGKKSPRPNFPGFDSHYVCVSPKSSGCVAFVNSGLPNSELPSLSLVIGRTVCSFLSVSLGSVRVRVGVVYIHPCCSPSVFEIVLNRIKDAVAMGGPVLVLGDFNARHSSFGIPCKDSERSKRLVEFCTDNELHILNQRDAYGVPTRANSVLDLAITNVPDFFTLSIDKFLAVSDHSALTVKYHDISLPRPPRPPSWRLKNMDWTAFTANCEEIFSSMLPSFRLLSNSITPTNKQQVIDHLCQLLTDSLNSVASLHSNKRPPSTSRRDKSEDHLRDLLSNYKRLHNQYKSLKRKLAKLTQPTPQQAKNLRAKLLSLLVAKKKWEVCSSDLAQRGWDKLCASVQDAKNVAWKVWRRTQPAARLPPNAVTQRKSDPLPANAQQSVDNMARFYARVMSTEPNPSWAAPPRPPQPSTTPKLDEEIARTLASGIEHRPSPLDTAISTEEIAKQLKGLRTKTAPGHDAIPSAFLKHASPAFAATLSVLFNASWDNGVFPSQWKLANAFSIFKKGDRSDPSAYRIISITSTLARVFERVVKCRLTGFLESSGFLVKEQAGFRHGHSTHDQIYRLRRDVHATIAKGKTLPVLFLDIVKAFDRVPHDRLLFKLCAQAGVTGKAWGWVRAFLTDRRFYVSSGGTKSRSVFARAGVPQGTVLAPLLFIVYINDLLCPKILKSTRMNAAMFADDVSAWPWLQDNIRTKHASMHDFLYHCSEWSKMWRLQFSTDKTQVVLFGRQRRPPHPPSPYMLCNQQVQMSKSYKYLGLLMDSDGSCRSHATQLITKTRQTAYYIARIFKRNRPPTPIAAFKLISAILIPQIAYGIQFITKMSEAHIQQLTQVLAYPLRRSLCLPRNFSAQRIIWEFGLPHVGSIHLRALLQFYNRSYTHLLSDRTSLPALCAHDVEGFVLDAVGSSSTLTVPMMICGLKQRHPTLAFPLSKETIDAFVSQRDTAYWTDTAAASYRELKPDSGTEMYLSVDNMPGAVIRSHVRLGTAMTPLRMWQARQVQSPNCPRCNVLGDTHHILLECKFFRGPRIKCQQALANLYFPVTLTMELLCGRPVALPAGSSFFNERAFLQNIHAQCLGITCDFLCAVSAKIFL